MVFEKIELINGQSRSYFTLSEGGPGPRAIMQLTQKHQLNFTPHVVAIQTGENIVQRILSFSQRASKSICILSAFGSVSSAELVRLGSRHRYLYPISDIFMQMMF